MTIAQQIGRLNTSIEHGTRVEEFVGAVRHWMVAYRHNNVGPRAAREAGLSERQVDFLAKAVTTPSSTSDSAAIAPHPLAASFLASLVGTGVFETMLGSMMQLPLRTTIVAVTAIVSGAPGA